MRLHCIIAEKVIPKVSVVMAVYNKAPYLRESIESVLNQDMADFELICVDAASTDESLKILKTYAAKDVRITIYSTDYTSVPAVTKNFGIDRTRGEYVFNLDADDYLRPDTLLNMYTKAKETGADAVVPDLQAISIYGKNLPLFTSGVKGDRSVLLTNRQAVTESLDWTIHGFALWSGALIRKLRLEEFGTFSDEYSARVLFYNCTKVAFSEGVYFHRTNEQSLTGKISLRTCDRPDATRRVADFLEQHLFNERNIDSLQFSAFEDCCFLLNTKQILPKQEASEAERRIRMVYARIDKGRVRKSVCFLTPGRAALWRPQGKVRKYLFALLTFLNWSSLKRLPLKYLFNG